MSNSTYPARARVTLTDQVAGSVLVWTTGDDPDSIRDWLREQYPGLDHLEETADTLVPALIRNTRALVATSDNSSGGSPSGLEGLDALSLRAEYTRLRPAVSDLIGITGDIKAAQDVVAALTGRRDDMIRTALADPVGPKGPEIANACGFTHAARVYQIRDHK